MKRLAALIILAVLVGCPIVVHADDPTATRTPTLRPLIPTPTSAYIYFRNTPTPWNIDTPPEDRELHFNLDNGETADIAINAYRWVNHDHLLDIISTGVLASTVFSLLMRIASRGTKTQE